MADLLPEEELRQKAVRALKDRLGPEEALRFLALVSREPFNYEEWRKRYFADSSVEDLFHKMHDSDSF